MAEQALELALGRVELGRELVDPPEAAIVGDARGHSSAQADGVVRERAEAQQELLDDARSQVTIQ